MNHLNSVLIEGVLKDILQTEDGVLFAIAHQQADEELSFVVRANGKLGKNFCEIAKLDKQYRVVGKLGVGKSNDGAPTVYIKADHIEPWG
jgi:hypothetical protein